jgi:glutathione S-transferase
VYQWAFYAMTEIEPPLIEYYRRRETAPEISASAAQRVRDNVAVIDAVLDGHEYLVGDRFSVADIVVSEVIRITARLGATQPSGRIASYLERMASRPARQRADAALT